MTMLLLMVKARSRYVLPSSVVQIKKTHKNHSMDGNTVMLFIKHHLVAYHVYIEYIVSTYHKMPFLICIIFQMCMHASMLIFKKYELRNFTGS